MNPLRIGVRAAALTALFATSAATAERSVMPTPAPPRGTGLPAGECIRLRDFGDHRIVDHQTLLVEIRGKATYRVTMRNRCLHGAGLADPIVIEGGMASAAVCHPHELDISIGREGPPVPCRVDSIVKLSPQELAVLPARLRP